MKATISGTVTDNNSNDLPGICISAEATDGSGGGSATSAANGTYSITGLSAGSYYVEFTPGCGSVSQNWVDQWWEDAPSTVFATPVGLSTGETIKGVNAAMQPGATVSGIVKANTGTLLSGICVYATNLASTWTSYTDSASDGAYAVIGAPAGNYIVEFTPGCGSVSQNWVDQWWKDTGNPNDATTIRLAAGQAVAGIDAAMQPGATISGTVASSTGGDLSGICVTVEPTAGSAAGGFAESGSNGAWSVDGLTTGSYTVEFSTGCGSASTNWLDQWWKDSSTSRTATPVAVTEGKTTGGINAMMLPGGIITGIVKTTTGAALPGICVTATNVTTRLEYLITSGATGTYSVEGLTTGAYTVGFQPGCGLSDNWLTQYWKGSVTKDLSTTVSVTAGATTAGVSPEMEPGGVITGTVKSSTGPLGGICVEAASANGTTSVEVPTASTATNGTYSIRGLPTGAYSLEFLPGCGSSANWLTQWANGAVTLGDATPILATAGKTTAGVNATLMAGGVITGTITGPGDSPVSGICVEAFSTTTGAVYAAPSGTLDGYSILGLPTSNYDVEFSDSSAVCDDTANIQYATQWYKAADTQATATAVAVTAGKTVSGINATMAAAGEITGTLTVAGGAAVSGVCVEAYPVVPGFLTAYATTSLTGAYTITGLSTGKYILDFTPDCGKANALPQYYKGASSPSTATEVSVTAGKTTAGVSSTLAVGGEISGTVETAAGSPLSSMCVDVTSTSLPTTHDDTETSSSGSYTVGGLRSAKYVVGFSDCSGVTDYSNQWYKGETSADKATLVQVTAGNTVTGIDAKMSSATGGTITGTVMRSASAGEPFVCVSAISTATSSGPAYESYTSSGGDGAYSFYDVPAGTYDIEFQPSCAGMTFGLQWYKGAATQSKAMPVKVTTGTTTSGVNVRLEMAGEISGVVKVGSTPLGSACVAAYYAGTSVPALSGTSGAGGAYEILGLEPGSYDVKFDPTCTPTSHVVAQWWKDASTQSAATAVTVKAGVDTTGISADLASGGQISGRVQNSSGSVLQSVEVAAVEAGKATVVASAESGPQGNYTLDLPAGSYDVVFNEGGDGCGQSIYAAQWWKDVTSESAAKPVTVVTGKMTTGVNSALVLASSQRLIPDC